MPAIKSLEELRKIKEEALQKREATQTSGRVQITVPMGTCGIAAGAWATEPVAVTVLENGADRIVIDYSFEQFGQQKVVIDGKLISWRG